MTRLKEDESGHVLRNVSDGLRAVILRCMEIKTEQRYGSATELIDALAGCGVRSVGFDRELLGKRSWEFATSVTAGKRTNLFTEVNRRIYDLRERFVRQKAPAEVKIGKRMYSVELTDLDLSDMELTEQKVGNLHYMKKLKRLNLSLRTFLRLRTR